MLSLRVLNNTLSHPVLTTNSGRADFSTVEPPCQIGDISLEYIQLQRRSQVKNDKKYPTMRFYTLIEIVFPKRSGKFGDMRY